MAIDWNKVGNDDWGAPTKTKTAAALEQAAQAHRNYYAEVQREEEERRRQNRAMMTQVENKATVNRFGTNFLPAKGVPTQMGAPGIANAAIGMKQREQEKNEILIRGYARDREEAEKAYNQNISRAQTSYGNTVKTWAAQAEAEKAKTQIEDIDTKLAELGVTPKEAAKMVKEQERQRGSWLGDVAKSAAKDSAASALANFASVFSGLERVAGGKVKSDENGKTERDYTAEYLQEEINKQEWEIKKMQKQINALAPEDPQRAQLTRQLRTMYTQLGARKNILARVETYYSEAAYDLAGKLKEGSTQDIQKAYEKAEGVPLGKLGTDITAAGLGMAADVATGAITGVTPLTAAAIRAAGGANLEAKNEGASDASAAVRGALEAVKVSLIGRISNVSGIAQKFSGKTAKLDGIVEAAIAKLAQNASSNPAVQRGLNYLFNALASGAGEGAEEMLETFVDPALDALSRLDAKQMSEYGSGEYWGQLLYDGLVGGIMGLAGGALDVGKMRSGVSETPNAVVEPPKTVTETPEKVTQAPQTATPKVNTPAETETAQRAEKGPTDKEVFARIAAYVNGLDDKAVQAQLRSRFGYAVDMAGVGGVTRADIEAVMKSPERMAQLGISRNGLTNSQLRDLIADVMNERTRIKSDRARSILANVLYGEAQDTKIEMKAADKQARFDAEFNRGQKHIAEQSARPDWLNDFAETYNRWNQIDAENAAFEAFTAEYDNLVEEYQERSRRAMEEPEKVTEQEFLELKAMESRLETLGAAVKVYWQQNKTTPEVGAESTAINDDPAQHTAEEQRVIEEYKGAKNAEDSRLSDANAPVRTAETANATTSATANASQHGGDVNGGAEMPVKAQKYLERKQNGFIRKLGDTLDVPRYARRDYLKPIVQEITNEYMQTGKVSDSSVNELFERAYDEGIKVDSEFYDEYKWLKDRLRDTAVTLTDADKSNIADWDAFRKSAFNTLKITNDGVPVDTVYQQLGEAAPGLFPAEITRPADQLVHMYEVARSIRKVEHTLDSYYGGEAEKFREWAKNDFTANINDMLGELAVIKRYTEERNTAKAPDAEITEESVRSAYKGMKDSRRELDKVKARNLLTQHDEVQLGRLLRGELELQNLNARNENVKGITEVFAAQQEYEKYAAEIRKYNQQRKENLRKTAEGYLATANDWKDKKAGISYSVNTMERNVRDIVKDAKLADSIIAEYFTPIHDAQAEATRTKNDYRNRVRALNLSRKVAEGNTISEAAAVQLLGEAEDNIKVLEESRGKIEQRDGKTLEDWRGIVADVWKQNPSLDKAKIDNAISEFHTIYDELFEKMNDARIANGYEPVDYRRGYFPHFQSGTDSKLAQFGRALGIDIEVDALPTTINGLTHTFKPGIRWLGNAQRRKGINTTYDAVEGFDRYIEGVADVIHQTENIQKLRSLATEIRYRTGDEGIKKQIDEVKAKTDVDDDQKHELIKEITEKGQFALSNFVVELDEYTNLLANKKSRHDRNFESDLGRKYYAIMKFFENRVAANMVAVNPASWLTNFIPITQGWASLDTKNLLGGMLDTLKAYKVNDGIVDRSSFLTNRRGSDPIVRTWTQTASNAASKPMEYIDQFTADTLVRARYKQNLKKGMSENAAMSEADAWTAGVMADRSKGALPTIFSRMNPVTKAFTQFQVEVNNQLGYLFKDLPREAKEGAIKSLATALLKFAFGAFVYNELYEYLIGRRPALDPIGIITGGVKDALNKDLNGWEVAEGVGADVLDNLPFVSGVVGGGRLPISSALPDIENLGKAALNEDWDSKKRWATVGKELSTLAYLVPPFGGGQLKKIVQGVTALVKGGSYSTDSQGRDILQYPVYNDTTAQKIKSGAGAVIFGKSSLKTGRDWVESGFKSLGAAETEVYKQMTEAGVPDTEAWDIIQTFRSTKKTEKESEALLKRRALQESDISGAGKAVIYYGLLASEKETKLMDRLADSGADMGDVTDALINIKNAEDSNSKRYYIAEAALPDEVKQEIYTALVSDTHGDDIYRITTTGLDFNDYLFIQNKYSEINEKNLSAANKTLEFERWIDSEGFNARQEKAIQESFKFYSMTPAQTDNKYDELTELGISADKAEELVKKASVYDMQTSEESLKFYRLAVSSVSSRKDRLSALTPWLNEGDLVRCTYAYEAGVDPAVWVTYKEQMYGKSTQAQARYVIDGLVGLDKTQRAILWQMTNKGWKAKNNPYSAQVGQQVYDFMHQED